MAESSSTKPSIFISYAHKDAMTLAKNLQLDLSNEGFNAWLDSKRLKGGNQWSVEIEANIDRAGVVIALLSNASYVSGICRGEQLRSLRKRKYVIPIKVQADCDLPIYFESNQWLDFSRPESYELDRQKLLEAIEEYNGSPLQGDYRAVLKQGYGNTYYNAPGLLECLVRRPKLLANARNKLFVRGSQDNIAVIALRGMGGIGKTVLALQLCHDDVVQQAFPDGVFWFTIGQESKRDFASRVNQVPGLQSLLGKYEGEEACKSQYRNALRNRAALIVLDDVWDVNDVKPFTAESPCSRILVTTRDRNIAASLGAEEFEASLLTDGESRQFLRRWSKWKEETLPSEAEEIIRGCGRLPLALSMIGASLRGEPGASWRDRADDLRDADISVLEGEIGDYQYTSFVHSMEVSLKALESAKNLEDKGRYLSLAVLPKGMEVPIEVLAALWGIPAKKSRDTLKRLIDLSLAQRECPERGLRLHDLQVDYLRTQYFDQAALEMIREAISLSAHVIAIDPGQFASQMSGRLFAYREIPSIAEFLERAAAGARTPWLRPLLPGLHPVGTPLRHTLVGHTKSSRAVALTPDGRLAVSASLDSTVKVWELASGRELKSLASHTGWVKAIALTGDGRLAVSASDDNTLKVWEVASGRLLHTLTRHGVSTAAAGPMTTSESFAVALSADGRRAVSGSADTTLRVWDVDGSQPPQVLVGHEGVVHAVALSADGRRAVSGSADTTLRVWDLKGLLCASVLVGHKAVVHAVALSADGHWAISGSHDQTVRVWDLDGSQQSRVLKGHEGWVNAVALSRDGHRAACGFEDMTMCVWDLDGSQPPRVLEGHIGEVSAVALSADGYWAVSGSFDQTVRVWKLDDSKPLRVQQGYKGSVNAALSADGRWAASSGCYDTTLHVWDLDGTLPPRVLEGHSGYVQAVALSADGRRAVAGSFDNTVRIWDLNGSQLPRILVGHEGGVNGVALSADGRRAVSGSDDRTVRVWDAEGSRRPLVLAHEAGVHGVALSADGLRVVSGSYDTTLRVWDLDARPPQMRVLMGHEGGVHGVALSADGRWAVSGSADKTVRVWDLYGNQITRVLVGHEGVVRGVALSADGHRVVSCSYDNTVRVWELADSLCLATFTCDAYVSCCAWAGSWIAAGDSNGQFHLFLLQE